VTEPAAVRVRHTAVQPRRGFVVIASRRRRSAAVSATLAAAFSLAVTGCSGSRPDYRGVCTDRQTGTRVDDDECRHGSPGHAWYYYGRGARYPAVG
jgi:hypothetical protein